MTRRDRKGIGRLSGRLVVVAGAVAAVAILVAFGTGITATNTIPATRVSNLSFSATPDTMKPSQCSGITLTTKFTGTGIFSAPTNNNTLLLGSSAGDVITGGNGNDCIHGGTGSDSINGSGGTDVCIGRVGTTFLGCETQVTF